MDPLETQIIERIYIIRKSSKIPDIDSIFKIISSNSANNLTKRDVEENLKMDETKCRFGKNKTWYPANDSVDCCPVRYHNQNLCPTKNYDSADIYILYKF